jgi:hypothetical protein
LFQYLVSQYALRGIGDEPLQSHQIALWRIHAAPLFPCPFLISGLGEDTVRTLERPFLLHGGLHRIPDGLAILQMNEVRVGDLSVLDQLIRKVTGEVETPLADELHRPVLVVLSPVRHSRQVAHQG